MSSFYRPSHYLCPFRLKRHQATSVVLQPQHFPALRTHPAFLFPAPDADVIRRDKRFAGVHYTTSRFIQPIPSSHIQISLETLANLGLSFKVSFAISNSYCQFPPFCTRLTCISLIPVGPSAITSYKPWLPAVRVVTYPAASRIFWISRSFVTPRL